MRALGNSSSFAEPHCGAATRRSTRRQSRPRATRSLDCAPRVRRGVAVTCVAEAWKDPSATFDTLRVGRRGYARSPRSAAPLREDGRGAVAADRRDWSAAATAPCTGASVAPAASVVAGRSGGAELLVANASRRSHRRRRSVVKERAGARRCSAGQGGVDVVCGWRAYEEGTAAGEHCGRRSRARRRVERAAQAAPRRTTARRASARLTRRRRACVARCRGDARGRSAHLRPRAAPRGGSAAAKDAARALRELGRIERRRSATRRPLKSPRPGRDWRRFTR